MKILFFAALILFSVTGTANINIVGAAGYSSEMLMFSTVPQFYFSNISTNISNVNGIPSYIDGNGTGCPNAVNENCHNASDTFTITATSNAAFIGSPNYFYLVYPGTAPVTGAIAGLKIIDSQPYVPGQAVTFTATWGTICNAINTANSTLGVGSNCNDIAATPGAHVAEFYLIADNTGTGQVGSEVLAFTVTFISSIPVNSSVSNQIGLYGFNTLPGDQKVYLQSLMADANFNITGENGVGAKNVLVYYTGVPLVNGSSDPTTQYAPSNFNILGPTTATAATGTFPILIDPLGNLQTNEVTGLTDGLMYYFHLAIVDNAGNIGYLTSPSDDSITHTAIIK